MSGFSATWLALREPADHRSVSAFVREQCARALAAKRPLRVVDLGSGTGSNLRGLAPSLGPEQQWTLVDYDPRLLEAAREALTGSAVDVSFRVADLSGGAFADVTAGAHVVTASALFDLVSPAVIDQLAEQVASAGQVFYTVLTYDGLAAWLPEHPADAAMRDAFNRHQRTDKGFGPAAGPDATACLADAFSRQGYSVVRGKSPWVLDAAFAELRREVDQGWADAVRETGLVPDATVDAWLMHRLSMPSAVTIVGHEDLLALPPSA